MLIFELLQMALGSRDRLSRVPSNKEWAALYEESEKQSVVGIMLDGIERIPEEQRPLQELLLQWIGADQIIEQNTIRLTKASVETVKFFHNKGFACTLLKGAAVGSYYPNPNRRQSGDVDVWLDGGREKIYDFARAYDKDGKLYGVTYHHIHFHLFDDVHVEAHIWPSFLSSPLRNHRLHNFFYQYRPSHDSYKPSLAFDRVFILLHCYQHMCGYGVGLRQIMDYFYVLKQGFTEEEKHETVYWIKELGMHSFAKGLMWVLKESFGLEDKYILMEPNEKEGRFIIKEVMMTGNFGHNDTRNWGSTKTPFSRFLFNLKRDVFLAKHYPHEALWQPFFSIYFYVWRVSKRLLN